VSLTWTPAIDDVQARARQSLGASDQAIYRAVKAVVSARGGSGVLADVGCGRGALWPHLRPLFTRCIGVDAVRYDGLPAEVEFRAVDLEREPLPIETGAVNVAVAVETIEHLENPRALVRELGRITRPGGLVVITTPNQRSLLSLLTLVVTGEFSAFRENSYPAHRTALLEVDLRRIAGECGIGEVRAGHTMRGRVPLTGWHYPPSFSRAFPRAFSDNVIISGVVAA
jgi:2-polyprenyl-3-methyl-5-hydroxy-6-metoxy-1,4-benzoquinol methylase